MKLVKAILTITALSFMASAAFATGTLWDDAVLMFSFPNGTQTGGTKISADNDGDYIWTADGGWSDDFMLAKYDQGGNLITTYNAGIDYRSLYVDNDGQLYAKAYAGDVFSLTQDGVPTYLYYLNDPDSQSSASFNEDDTELYTMSSGMVYRYSAANGTPLGSFPLIGYGTVGTENNYPDYIQMETNGTGRILTYTTGVVSEWDLAGDRVGQCNVAIDTPGDFDTIFSFGVGNDNLVYLYNAATASWNAYDIGLGGVTATESASWSDVKALY